MVKSRKEAEAKNADFVSERDEGSEDEEFETPRRKGRQGNAEGGGRSCGAWVRRIPGIADR